MNRTEIEGSNKYEIVCLGWVEDLDKLENKEKGFTAVKSARREGIENNPDFIQEIQVGKVEKAELFENGTLEFSNGQRIDNFADFKTVKSENAKWKKLRSPKELGMSKD